MITLKSIQNVSWEQQEVAPSYITTLYNRYIIFADTQKSLHTVWWMISLLAHSCVLVPLTFLFVYSFHGPVVPFLGASLVLFFSNIIANMGGASTRFTIFIFFLSLAAHIAMVAATAFMLL
ncbi:hypothetical protein GS399_15975 [Pedobacter sp. HMF7647]|uniref:Uncharacterized protein n=1 Tax=Hufsiella arboris TaxID=2695275 RepID=A0A7K1YD14_9SPHI|nr:hypothetical protein [Hufsiella arboris]MXV52474.1 hypothetical protein [Hufsiella arboris]